MGAITHIQHVFVGFRIEMRSSLELWVGVRGAKDLGVTLNLEAAVEIRRLLDSHLVRRSKMLLASIHLRVLVSWLVDGVTMAIAPAFIALLTALAASSIWVHCNSLRRWVRLSLVPWRRHLICAVSVLDINFVKWEVIGDVVKDKFIRIHYILRRGTQVRILLTDYVVSIMVIGVWIVSNACWSWRSWRTMMREVVTWVRRSIHIVRARFTRVTWLSMTVVCIVRMWTSSLTLRRYIIASVEMMRGLHSLLIGSLEDRVTHFARCSRWWLSERRSIGSILIKRRIDWGRRIDWVVVVLSIHLLLLLVFVQILSLPSNTSLIVVSLSCGGVDCSPSVDVHRRLSCVQVVHFMILSVDSRPGILLLFDILDIHSLLSFLLRDFPLNFLTLSIDLLRSLNRSDLAAWSWNRLLLSYNEGSFRYYHSICLNRFCSRTYSRWFSALNLSWEWSLDFIFFLSFGLLLLYFLKLLNVLLHVDVQTLEE